MATVKYFSGTEEVTQTTCMDSRKFFAAFGFVHRFKNYDSFSKWVGRTTDGRQVPVTRIIFRKSNPSLHKCDARCRHAKGGNCECSCGGQYHGAGG